MIPGWSALERKDRAALAVAAVLCAVGVVGPRLDPDLAAARSWVAAWGPYDLTWTSFVDANGVMLIGQLQAQQPPQGRASEPVGVGLEDRAYESDCETAPDPWGRPWILVVRSTPSGRWPRCPRGSREMGYYSAGRDGVFEFGRGDDIDLDALFGGTARYPSLPVPGEAGWWWCVGLALGFAAAWSSGRAWFAPPTSRGTTEVALGVLMSPAPLVALHLLVDATRPDRWVPVPDGLLVSPRAAIRASLAVVVVIACILVRVRVSARRRARADALTAGAAPPTPRP
jgi:hypothetical protein